MRKISILLFTVGVITLFGLILSSNKSDFQPDYPEEVNGPSSEEEKAEQLKTSANQPIIAEKVNKKGVSRSLSATEYAKLLEKSGIKISKTGGEENAQDETRCKALIYRSLQIVPKDKEKNLQEVILMFEPEVRRGYGSKSRIKIRCVKMEDSELISIFLHELGHVIDLGSFNGTKEALKSEFQDGDLDIYQDDLSLKYYRISWINEKTQKTDVKDTDFVSGYAKSDPFEDFAEAFNYYIAHGPAFRKLAQYNSIMALKYDFIKNDVFQGKEFMVGKREIKQVKPDARDYDSTIIGYNWKAVLGER